MPCYTPIAAYRGPGGQVYFDSKKGWSDRPLSLPCGQCRHCRADRARMWALRCYHEAQTTEQKRDPETGVPLGNCFLTLTYDDEHLPEDWSVDVRHWQDFAKRLRYHYGKLRFFHCGEYGDENLRPHYHALIFGQDFRQGAVRVKKDLFTNKEIEKIWGMGIVGIGDVTFASACYVARYVMKKRTVPNAEDPDVLEAQAEYWSDYQRFNPETGEVWMVKPEYVTMSRNPGIGSDWFHKYKNDVYPSDEVIAEGKRYRPPRYYDEKLDKEELASYKDKRLRAAAKRADDNTPERLKVKEVVHKKRDELFQRRPL